MIRFLCKNCGRKFSVPEIHAGKKGKCPKCKNVIVVPGTEPPDTIASQGGSGKPESTSRNSALDLTLLDVPQEHPIQKQPIDQAAEFEKALEAWPRHGKEPAANETESTTQRKLPWPIDIFLYPTSKAGLVTIAVITLIRLFFRVMVRAMGESTQSFLPFLAFFAVLAIVGLLVRVILYLYLYWYFCECVRDSAAGGVRAPEIMGHAPGLGEMFWKLIRTIFCLAFFFGPAIVYFLETRKTDAVFWCLAFYGVFFFPMSLLAFVLFDSLRALNPIVFIGSILSTFFPYCAMIAVFMVAGAFIFERVPNPRDPSTTLFVIWVVGIYLAMVAAHLLGWFYHRYENELNWDV